MDGFITMDHGSGGVKTSELIDTLLRPAFANPALDALGEITGETMRETVIDEVFATFCVGK